MGSNSSAGHPDPDNYDDDEHHDFEVYYGDIDSSDEVEEPSTDDDIPNPEDYQDEIAEDEDPNFYWDTDDDGSTPDRDDD